MSKPLEKASDFCYYISKDIEGGFQIKMAYKKNTMVISVPISVDANDKLKFICKEVQGKSKTKLAGKILEEYINKWYDDLTGVNEDDRAEGDS